MLGEWLGELSSVNMDEVIAAMLEQVEDEYPDPPELRRARKLTHEALANLDRYVDAHREADGPGSSN
jgi:hypothetical protein